jgi:hypothetical protein
MRNMAPFKNLAEILPPTWIDALRNALLAYNPLVGGLFHLSILNAQLCPNAHLILEDMGTATEIAAVMNYENTTQSEVRARRMMVIRRDGANQTISTISRLWEPLAYPLLFPHGTLVGVSMEHMMILAWTEMKRRAKFHLMFQHARLCTIAHECSESLNSKFSGA